MARKYTCVATKVTKETADIINRTAAALNVSSYQMLQLILVCFTRSADTAAPSHYPGDDILHAVDVFENATARNARHAGRPTSRKATAASAAVYLVTDSATGVQIAVLIEKGRRLATFNADAILLRILKATYPSAARAAETLCRRMETRTPAEAIRVLLRNALGDDDDTKTIAEMFADNRRMDNGRNADLVKYRRHNNRGESRAQLTMEFNYYTEEER